ncbi:HEAT repeat domain-containing protein [Streptomyces dysideae]|uniref:HEAT repeat domain-containing protein n=1 Tax=Streptomyces dysideae TaxID=909626 RepID=A0A101V1X3_9ACTN|nr:HEAT repeat domain-containing protein [Streptomyces dysideae]KUO20948.1 hypothetical protein AQJ91_11545 [Streptomyces dysideae]
MQQAPEPAALSPEETDEALRRYATRIRESYGRLDLEVLIATEEGEHPPVGLDEVVEELCAYRSHETETWELAFDRLRNDPALPVRMEALRATRYCRDDARVWAAVRERASEDDAASIRALALARLVMGRGDDAATRQLIQDRATSDSEPRVRVNALRWWAVCETDDSAPDLLRDLAVADPDPEPRIAALQSLAFGWPAHPETLPLLRERAEADEEEDVREAFAKALAAAEALAPLADQLP